MPFLALLVGEVCLIKAVVCVCGKRNVEGRDVSASHLGLRCLLGPLKVPSAPVPKPDCRMWAVCVSKDLFFFAT